MRIIFTIHSRLLSKSVGLLYSKATTVWILLVAILRPFVEDIVRNRSRRLLSAALVSEIVCTQIKIVLR